MQRILTTLCISSLACAGIIDDVKQGKAEKVEQKIITHPEQLYVQDGQNKKLATIAAEHGHRNLSQYLSMVYMIREGQMCPYSLSNKSTTSANQGSPRPRVGNKRSHDTMMQEEACNNKRNRYSESPQSPKLLGPSDAIFLDQNTQDGFGDDDEMQQ